MPDVLPSTLVAYMQQSFEPSSQTLLTSVLNAPATWLTVRFLYAALRGLDHEGSKTPSSRRQPDAKANVIFLSFLRPLDLWAELGRKIGIDIANYVKTKRLLYIDGLNSIDSAGNEGAPPAVRLKPLQLRDILATVTTAIQSFRSASTGEALALFGPIIIIDGLDFVLASQLDVDTMRLQQFLSTIRAQSQAVIISCNADSPLLHNSHDSATPLEQEHSSFVTTAAHQSSWIIQLRGLDTGTAKDVTGVLRISRGGANELDDGNAANTRDEEWLYHVKGDGSVRTWSRGE